jgi:hypothetical protein
MMHSVRSAITALVLASLLILPFALQFSNKASALELTTRSIQAGSSRASDNTNHLFSFNIPSAQDVGAIQFEYCGNTPLFTVACIPPAGLDVSGAGLQNQTGETGFAIDGATNTNTLVITRVPAMVTPGISTYLSNNVVNPSTPNQSAFVRITTYDTDPGSGSVIDVGSVVFSTSGAFDTQGFVPPYLTFCVGLTVGMNCTTTAGNYINLGELRHTLTRAATSQFAAATNDATGYSVFVQGTTLTAGNFVIAAMTNPAASQVGQNQYGINLRANSLPSVGGNPTGAGSAVAVAGYNAVNNFKFANGDLIARSTLPTRFNRFTVSYITNVNSNQPPGVYSSTLTYLAVAAF